MSNEREYLIISPVSKGGTVHKTGTVSLTDKEAKRLLSFPKPPIADPDNPTTDTGTGEKSGTRDGAGTQRQDPKPLTEAEIVEAIGRLNPDNKDHWTKGNKPELAALENILGQRPTSAERDTAFAVFKEQASE